MSMWTIRKNTAERLPWRAWDADHREATEHGFCSQRSAFAYALLNADPRAELIA